MYGLRAAPARFCDRRILDLFSSSEDLNDKTRTLYPLKGANIG